MARPDHELPDTGLPDHELPDRDLVERIWRILQRWAVPVMMTLAYVFLAATSETNNTGKAWMGVGLVFVLIVWFMFRGLTETAALSRALSIGDVAHRACGSDDRVAQFWKKIRAGSRELIGVNEFTVVSTGDKFIDGIADARHPIIRGGILTVWALVVHQFHAL
jgi:hypothetical protein